MKVNLKNMPRLQLKDLLRRRKMTLRQLLDESGTTTFAGLCQYCDRLGVGSPTETEFNVAFPAAIMISNPQHGVVSLPPLPIISEVTGKEIEEEVFVFPEPQQEKKTKRKRVELLSGSFNDE